MLMFVVLKQGVGHFEFEGDGHSTGLTKQQCMLE